MSTAQSPTQQLSPDERYQRLVEYKQQLGGVASVADALSVSRQNVYNWLAKSYEVPTYAIPILERAIYQKKGDRHVRRAMRLVTEVTVDELVAAGLPRDYAVVVAAVSDVVATPK